MIRHRFNRDTAQATADWLRENGNLIVFPARDRWAAIFFIRRICFSLLACDAFGCLGAKFGRQTIVQRRGFLSADSLSGELFVLRALLSLDELSQSPR